MVAVALQSRVFPLLQTQARSLRRYGLTSLAVTDTVVLLLYAWLSEGKDPVNSSAYPRRASDMSYKRTWTYDKNQIHT